MLMYAVRMFEILLELGDTLYRPIKMPFAPSVGEWSFKDFMGFFLLYGLLYLFKVNKQ